MDQHQKLLTKNGKILYVLTYFNQSAQSER